MRPVSATKSPAAAAPAAPAGDMASTFMVSKEQRAKAAAKPAVPVHAADLFGADPADPSFSKGQGLASCQGLSPAQPKIDSDLELAFSKYEKSKGAAKPAAGDVNTAMQ